MARGTTLGALVTKLRIAARYDPNPAVSKSVDPLFVQTLQDVQERLYDQFDWPFLKVQRDKAAAPGQRYYDVPADMNLERIGQVDTLFGNVWEPVQRGITLNDYSGCNSDLGQRRDPVSLWDVRDTGSGEQIELWPIPASAGTVRFSGIRHLKPLVADSDKADLDDQLIVLYAAAELLAGKGAGDEAKLKLQQAGNRLSLLQGRVTHTRDSGFVLGGGPDCENEHRGRPRAFAVVATQPGATTTSDDDPGDLAGLLD